MPTRPSRLLLAVVAVLAMAGGVFSGIGPAAAQDKLPLTERQEGLVAAAEQTIARFACPEVGDLQLEDYTPPDATTASGTAILPSASIVFSCRYGQGRSITITMTPTGVRPGRICADTVLPYSDSRERLLGRPFDPLALQIEIRHRTNDEPARVDALEAGALDGAETLRAGTETCPTPRVIPPADERVAEVRAAADRAIENCDPIDRSRLPENAGNTELTRREIRGFSGGLSPDAVEGLNPQITILCGWTSTSFEVSALVVPANPPLDYDIWADRAAPYCSGPDRLPDSAVTVTLQVNDVTGDQVTARAEAVAAELAAVAIDCETEQSRVDAYQVSVPTPIEAPLVDCPAVPEMDPHFFSDMEGSRQVAQFGGGIPRTYPGIDADCIWELADDPEQTTELQIWIYLIPDGQPVGDIARLCGAEPLGSEDDNFARIVSTDRAAFVEVAVRNARGDTWAIGQRAATEWLAAVAPEEAASCAGIPDVSIDALSTPIPPYLAEAFAAAADGTFAVATPVASDPAPATDTDDADGAPDPAADGEDSDTDGAEVAAPSPGEPTTGSSGDDPWYVPWLRALRIVMLVLSLLALAVALLLVRRPNRIRPVMESARIAFTLAGAGVMFVVLSVDTPLWALAVALAAGAALGVAQGRNLVVTLQRKGLYAQRSAIAIAAFAAGLALTQVAGLLNRTGAISVGLALSFLSAATSVGLIAGRRPAISRAMAGGAAAAVVMAVLLGPASVPPTQAQEPTIDAGAAALNAAVQWDAIQLIGGVTAGTAELAIAPGLAEPPPPLVRELTDATMRGGFGASFTGTETWTFALDGGGLCCDIFYAATGIQDTLSQDGWVDSVSLEVGDHLISTVRPYDTQGFGQSDVRFSDTKRTFTESGCGREVAEVAEDSTPERAVALKDGRENTGVLFVDRPSLYAPCELDISIGDATAVTPEPPPADAAVRIRNGRTCPVNQEVVDALAAASAFDGANTATLTKRFVEPNAPACSNFNLAFGDDRPGGTRNELTYELAPGPDADEIVVKEYLRTGDEYLNFMPRNEQVANVCPTDDRGVAIDPDGVECQLTTFHTLDNARVTVHTDWETADGPNVHVRAVYPTGIFRFRCHHCTPGDPAIADFLQTAATLAQLDEGGADLEGLGEAGAPIADRADPGAGDAGGGSGAADATGSGDDELGEVDAAWAGLAGLLAAMGISWTVLAESGVKPRDILDQLSPEEREAVLGRPDPEPEPSRAERLQAEREGQLAELAEAERIAAERAAAERAEIIERGDFGVYDPRLDRTVYLGSQEELDADYGALNDRWDAEIRTRTGLEWEARREAWEGRRRLDEAAMAADRAAIEAFEQAQSDRIDRVNAGIARIDDPDLRDRIEVARSSGNLRDLEDIYYESLLDRMDASAAEAAEARRDAAIARAGELAAQGLVAASRAGLTVAGGPLGVAYTAAGLAVISGAEEGYQAYFDGKEVGEVVARTGFGVVLGVRDATLGRMGQIPGVPIPAAAQIYATAVGDSSEAYVRGRMDGLTHEQALAAAETAFVSSAASELVGAGFDALPPGVASDLGQMGATMVIGGTTSWAGGGDFLDGALDAGAGFVGGRAGGGVATHQSGRSTDIAPDVRIQDQLDVNRVHRSEEIPIEQQGASVQAAWDQRQTVERPGTLRQVVDADGRLQTVVEPALGGGTIEVSDPRTVLEGLTRTADSRTGKQAPQAVQDVVVNTRNQEIYAEPDAITIANAMDDPRLQAMVQPGDEVMMHTFSTPGQPASLGADRDARLAIRRPDPEAPGGYVIVEVDRAIWERDAYTQFANQTRTIYGGEENMPPAVRQEVEDRIPRIIEELQHEGTRGEWSDAEIRDRAISEAHNQLFTDRTHVEASQANTDQGVAFQSVANNQTIADLRPALEAQGLVGSGDVVTIRDTPDGPSMVVTTSYGDELQVPPDLWASTHRASVTEHGDATVTVAGNITPEALAAQRGQGTLSDPADYARMWDTKSGFYAGLNEPEAVAQSQKGVAQLIAIREGYRQQGLELPPISADDQAAMLIVLEAQVGVGAAPDGTIETRLQRIYGPDATLASSLGRLAMLNEDLGRARYVGVENMPAAGTVTSGTLIRNAVTPGSGALPEELPEDPR